MKNGRRPWMGSSIARLVMPLCLVAVGTVLVGGPILGLGVHDRLGRPGPGYAPLLVGIGLVLLGSWDTLNTYRRGAENDDSSDVSYKPDDGSHKADDSTAIKAILALLLGVVLFDRVGAFITIGLVGSFLMWRIQRETLLRSALTSVAVAGVAYVVFVVIFGLRLPTAF